MRNRSIGALLAAAVFFAILLGVSLANAKECFTIKYTIETISKVVEENDFSANLYLDDEAGDGFAYKLIGFKGEQTQAREIAIVHFFDAKGCMIGSDGRWSVNIKNKALLAKAVERSALVYQRHGQVY